MTGDGKPSDRGGKLATVPACASRDSFIPLTQRTERTAADRSPGRSTVRREVGGEVRREIRGRDLALKFDGLFDYYIRRNSVSRGVAARECIRVRARARACLWAGKRV